SRSPPARMSLPSQAARGLSGRRSVLPSVGASSLLLRSSGGVPSSGCLPCSSPAPAGAQVASRALGPLPKALGLAGELSCPRTGGATRLGLGPLGPLAQVRGAALGAPAVALRGSCGGVAR